MEMGHEPRNVQVVVKEDEQLFLVDEEGIITFTEHVSNDIITQEHVSLGQDHVNNDDASLLSHCDDVDVVSLRSALCEARRQNESLIMSMKAR